MSTLVIYMITTMSTFRIIFLTLLLAGCASKRMWEKFTEIDPIINGNSVKPHAFQNGIYSLSVKVSESRLQELYPDSYADLASKVNENHIASSLWFMDNSRFIQVSRFRDHNLKPFQLLNLHKPKEGDVYHMGRYSLRDENLTLDYLENDTVKFTITAKFENNLISFRTFENVDSGTKIPNINDLATLFEEPQNYLFHGLNTWVQVGKNMYLDSIYFENDVYKYIIVQEAKSDSRKIKRDFRKSK